MTTEDRVMMDHGFIQRNNTLKNKLTACDYEQLLNFLHDYGIPQFAGMASKGYQFFKKADQADRISGKRTIDPESILEIFRDLKALANELQDFDDDDCLIMQLPKMETGVNIMAFIGFIEASGHMPNIIDELKSAQIMVMSIINPSNIDEAKLVFSFMEEFTRLLGGIDWNQISEV